MYFHVSNAIRLYGFNVGYNSKIVLFIFYFYLFFIYLYKGRWKILELKDGIRRYSKNTKLSMAGLGHLVSAEKSTVYCLGKGEIRPTVDGLIRLAKFFGIAETGLLHSQVENEEMKKMRTVKMFSNFDCGTLNMSLKNNNALVSHTKAGRNTSELFVLSFVTFSPVKVSFAFILR